MPVDLNYNNPTGKRNALASFKKWLETAVPSQGLTDFSYSWLSDVSNAKVFANVGISELPYFQPGVSAFGMEIFPANTHAGSSDEQPSSQGTLSAALLQIEIKTDQAKERDALQRLYRIRDRIVKALRMAGIPNPDTLAVAVPGIEIKDWGNGGVSTGIFARVPLGKETALQEQYAAPDETVPNIHTLRLLVQLEWFELN